ncbi:hypothetical protein [Sphingobium sp.]|uniref:hypothetical protein n=1 Tax=Sphingobium sp. TaxID=1912891 RepID=UPI0028BD77FD|nr:hypothetical protein [Sphingobium sp.]
MSDEMSLEESRKILSVATDIRPDENVHEDPALSVTRTSHGRPVTAAESRRIMSLAADIRPMENVHPEADDSAAE